MRKLASLRKVKDLKTIEGADSIELAIVDGWQCVAKKNEFKVGDLAVYFEIDSFLPIQPEFEFLGHTKKMLDKEGYLLKTRRFMMNISQGLLLPISLLNRFFPDDFDFQEGTDVTDILNVIKYEKPIPAELSHSVSGDFPSFIHKTECERIQNVFDSHNAHFINDKSDIIQDLKEKEIQNNSIGLYSEQIQKLENMKESNPIKDLEFEVSLKLDGTSMTCYVINPEQYEVNSYTELTDDIKQSIDGHFGVCQRNLELRRDHNNTYWKVAHRDIENKMIDFYRKTKRNIAIQFELMGEGIQKNRENLHGHHAFAFSIWDIDQQRYLLPHERMEILNYLDIQSTIIYDNLIPFQTFDNIQELLLFAEGKSINSLIREGLVFKSTKLINGQIISFKVISNKFLLKEK